MENGIVAVNLTVKSIKNETGHILIASTNKDNGIQVITGLSKTVDLEESYFFCVLPYIYDLYQYRSKLGDRFRCRTWCCCQCYNRSIHVWNFCLS